MKPFLKLSTMLIACTITSCAFSQQIIFAKNLKSILLTTNVGSLGGSVNVEIEVVKEMGAWNSYQTKRYIFGLDPTKEKSDTLTERKLIATLTEQQVAIFLNAIAVIRPKLDIHSFNLTPEFLIADLKRDAKDPKQDQSELKKVITAPLIQNIILATIKDEDLLDYASTCSINVFAYGDYNMKLATKHIYATKLPWTINGVDSYDMNISRFFLAAIGNEEYPNKYELSLESLKEKIYYSINHMYKTEPVGTYRWQYDAPDNLKLISQNFKYTKTARYNREYDCTLQNGLMADNVHIWATLDIRDKTGIMGLLDFNDLLKGYLNKSNFVFKYFSGKQECYINFSYYPKTAPNLYTDIKKKMPLLKDVDPSKIVSFTASAPDDTSNWLLLPDNRLLLTYHSVTTKDGKAAPIFPPSDPNLSWITKSYIYMLFNADGTLISKSR